MPLLETTQLTKDFGGLRAINSLGLHIDQGEIVSLIGPNGAGKTTFFNLITGLYPQNTGDIIFDGHNLKGMPPSSITKLGIARTFQTVRLFNNMTVLENVMVAQHSRTKSGVFGAILQTASFREEEEMIREKAKEVLSFFGSKLTGYRFDQPASMLSYANRRRLEIARAMATEAKLLLLDEPTAGMNPRETQDLAELIGKMRDEKGFTILFIEHDMRVVKGVSERVIVLDYGQLIAEGNYEHISQNDRVLEAYLGKKAENA
ncbi:MAG: ABC transporter ATP-binding protein [Chloroflexi bacterium]|nr:ABC transporter ATP-binding protein [Chloroflexota bacterium]